MTQRSQPSPGYDPAFFEHLVAAEDRHFWFRHRNTLIGAVVASVVEGQPPGYRVLEVGCGTGNTLRVLEQVCGGGVVVGTDPFEQGLRIARRRVRCAVHQAEIDEAGPPGEFALIAAFDVLEHVADDTAALRTLRTRLRSDGRLVLTVPAHMHLWSYADEAAHHYRRYSSAALSDVLRRSGYTVEYMTPFMSALYPLMWARRRLLTWRGREVDPARGFHLTMRDLRISPWNGLLERLLGPERRRVESRQPIPFGTSLLAVAQGTG